MSDKISVIIPAYNSQDTIERCLNSIQNQTYKNIEIIVVNDGSKDDTEKIVSDLQAEDNRIKLFSIPNGGVSNARNTGIDNATGDFITFVDSDDYIDQEMYQTLVDLTEEYNVQIAHCSYKNILPDGTIIKVGDNNKIIIQDHDEALESLISARFFSGSLCNKLYCANLLNNLKLNEDIKYNEDVLLNYLLFDKVDKSIYIDKPYYNYVAVESSATHSGNPIKYNEDIKCVAEIILSHSKGKSYQDLAEYNVAYKSLCLCRSYLFSNDKKLKIKNKDLKSELKKYKNQGLYKRKKDFLSYILLVYFPLVYKWTYRVYDKIRIKKLDPEQ